MNLGMTLLLQASVFVFCLSSGKFVLAALADAVDRGRRRQIADGLGRGREGKASLAIAQKEVDKLIAEAKAKTADIVAQAEKQRNATIEASKADARAGERESRWLQTKSRSCRSRPGRAARPRGRASKRSWRVRTPHPQSRDLARRCISAPAGATQG